MNMSKRSVLWTGETLLADLGLRTDQLASPIAPVEAVKIYPGHVQPGDLFVVRAAAPYREAPEGPPNHPEAVARALFRGAVAAITDQDLQGFADHAPIIRVPDLLAAHHRLGQVGRHRMAGELVAITGSVGKTTTKDLLHQTLAFFGPSSKTEGNLNGFTGVTSTLASLRDDQSYAVIELATTYSGSLPPLAALAAPDLGLLTNIGDAHLENFGSREAILADKIAVLQSMQGGHPALVGRSAVALDRSGMLGRLGRDVLVVGTQAQDDIQLLDCHLEVHRTCARIRVGAQVKTVVVPCPGIAYAHAACFVLGSGLALGIDLDEMIAAMLSFQHPNMQRGTRWRLKLGNGFAEFIDDAQNSVPVSMRALLDYLALRKARRKILVMGDMLDLGEDALAQHLDLAPALNDSGLDHLVAIGPLAGAVAETVADRLDISVFPDLETAAEPVRKMLRPGDLIAVKGTGYMNLGALRQKLAPLARQVLIRSNWLIEDIATP